MATHLNVGVGKSCRPKGGIVQLIQLQCCHRPHVLLDAIWVVKAGIAPCILQLYKHRCPTCHTPIQGKLIYWRAHSKIIFLCLHSDTLNCHATAIFHGYVYLNCVEREMGPGLVNKKQLGQRGDTIHLAYDSHPSRE